MKQEESPPSDEITRADGERAMREILEEAGVTLDELREQARRGRFSSSLAHDAWFVVSTLADAFPPE
jgi:8-oxo-dGTP pyrophosphatase MutT (NUDIX family)